MFINFNPIICKIGIKIGKSLAEIENFLKEKYIQEMVLEGSNHATHRQSRYHHRWRARYR